MIYIDETDGSRTSWKPSSHPFRAFSDSDWVQASNYQEMVKKRLEQEKKLNQQTEALERQAGLQKNAERRERRLQNKQSGRGKFHGLYCLLFGWWLAMLLVCCIFPLFSSGGRSLIKKVFGIW